MITNDIHLTPNVMIPETMVIGLADGAALDSDFDYYTAADDRVIKLTEDDGLVETAGDATDLLTTTASGGGHAAGTAAFYIGGQLQEEHSGNGRDATGTYGNHAGHSIDFDLVVKQSKLRLIQAKRNTAVPSGGVMFGDFTDNGQTPYDLMNDHGGYLSCGATSVVDELLTPNTTGYNTFPHDHLQGSSTGDPQTTCEVAGDPGGTSVQSVNSHAHGGGTATVDVDLMYVMMQAFLIINRGRIRNLHGLWPGAGIPPGWRLAGGFDGRYLRFTDDSGLLGNTGGSGEVDIVGTTGSVSHYHDDGGSVVCPASLVYHSNNKSHVHSYSLQTSFDPDNLLLKLVVKI